MHAPRTTIWAIEEHTLVKHQILNKYLEWWLPIVTASNENVIIFDGFAGPGEYKGGEPGSPVIAIDALLRSLPEAVQQNKVTFLFVEQKNSRCKHLSRVTAKKLQAQRSLSTIKYFVHKNDFELFVGEYFTSAEQVLTDSPPCFAFIDPFGFSGMPMQTISHLVSNTECEVLITFIYEGMNRFLSSKDKKHQYRYDELFGTPEWRMIVNTSDSPGEREQKACDLYCTQLKNICNISYVCMFRMINKRNTTHYFLVFGTNKLESLKKMKDVFWDIDRMNGYNFSDFEDHAQLYLFPPEPDYDFLRRILINKFGKTTASISEIEKYILAETSFSWSACQDYVLKSMEETSLIKVTSPKLGRKIGDYSGFEYIQFL